MQKRWTVVVYAKDGQRSRPMHHETFDIEELSELHNMLERSLDWRVVHHYEIWYNG